VERRGFFATHRGLLELPRVWETVMDWIDAPAPPGAAAAGGSAALFPHSHAVAAVAGSGAGGADDSALRRGRAHRAALRAEADARTERHRAAWHAMGTALPGYGHGPVSAPYAGRLGEWEVVNEHDVPSRASGCFTNPIHGRQRQIA
jgi:hypothetical protein